MPMWWFTAKPFSGSLAHLVLKTLSLGCVVWKLPLSGQLFMLHTSTEAMVSQWRNPPDWVMNVWGRICMCLCVWENNCRKESDSFQQVQRFVIKVRPLCCELNLHHSFAVLTCGRHTLILATNSAFIVNITTLWCHRKFSLQLREERSVF